MADNGVNSIKKAWQDANLAPLWERSDAHKVGPGPEKPYLWEWEVVRPLIEQAIKVVSPEDVERRVLSLTNPKWQTSGALQDRSTLKAISTALQILLPGESARPHRHSMSALRFVLEGGGAVTTTDGKDCLMEEGDLILTPGWCWHEHIHEGSDPIVWMDILDSPLHRYLGTDEFEPGPVKKLSETSPDAAFSTPGIVPANETSNPFYSPVFRYPYKDVVAALACAPVRPDGSRCVRYINPMSGQSVLAMIDTYMLELAATSETVPFRTTSNAICTVIEGSGESRVGDNTIVWKPKDIFTIPQGNWITHRSSRGIARLLMISDRQIFSKLGLLEECYQSD